MALDKTLKINSFYHISTVPKHCRWRATLDCKWDGSRNFKGDRKCNEKIPADISGSCRCRDGRIMNKKGCETGEFDTCEEACRSKDINTKHPSNMI